MFAFILFATIQLYILSHANTIQLRTHHCNASYPCHKTTFSDNETLHIHCNDHHSCNNISILHSPCHVHCNVPMSCINIDDLLGSCRCHGHCIQRTATNRRLLSNDDNLLTNLPDYVYMSIIGGLVLICSILLCIMYCKWRSERIINRNNSARARHDEYIDEETRSLSGKIDPQMITTDVEMNTLNPNYHTNNKQIAGKYDPMMLCPEHLPLSDDERAKSPFTATTFTRTPSPGPYNPTSPYTKPPPQSHHDLNISPHVITHESTNSKSEIVSANDASGQSQFSSQQSHVSGIQIIMQPVPSPNTTPQSHTMEISGGHKQIIHHKRRRGYNQDSLSMSSISIPYNNRKESITTSTKYNAIKEEEAPHEAPHDTEEDMVMHCRNNVNSLNIPNSHAHEKSHSNISLSSIPLDRISVMAPDSTTQHVHSEDEVSDDHVYAPHPPSDELRQVFDLNAAEDDSHCDTQVSDHEDEFEKEENIEHKKRKKKKRKKEKKKRKKKKKKKRKNKSKSKNALQKEEFEYEPDFVDDMEGTAANHHPPQHVMGVLPLHGLEKQVAMDKVGDETKRSLDVQSTVSSHPAFDAKNLKHFLEFVDEEEQMNDDERHGAAHAKVPKMTEDGAEKEYKEDDSESMSSGTSNSSDDYSYSTSNEHEYIRSDVLSLASADPYPLHKIFNTIKEDQILQGNENADHHTAKKRKIFCLHDDIYGVIISFMGRHDRWLHCQLVCKSWNELVHDKHWIFTQHMSLEEAHRLKCGDKVDHRDNAGRFIKSTILNRKEGTTMLHVHYDGWSSKWDSWCDYSHDLHKFAVVRSISRCPRVRGKHIEEKMFVDIKPSYRHGKHCNWRKGKVRRLDDYSGQIEVLYKYKQKKYLLWVHLDNKYEVDRVAKHSRMVLQQHNIKYNRCSNYSAATTVHEQ